MIHSQLWLYLGSKEKVYERVERCSELQASIHANPWVVAATCCSYTVL
jgi:hypothetical protein